MILHSTFLIKTSFLILLGAGLFVSPISIYAQGAPDYLNADKPIDVRVNDLISKMTLKEKVSQMMNSSPAIPRLHIPAYDWWNEGLHGVARSGVATVFPQAIGMAATFDDSLLKQEAVAISDEARAMYNASVEKGNYEKYGGLTFWSPNVNLFRDPRWGRGQETYGEDPFLTSRMGVAYVKGMQGDHPDYLKTAACAKHFAVYSGPEEFRHEFDANISRQDLFASYLPTFHALVQAGVAGVMCAYNAVDGEPCCANTYLLDDILRDKWGFQGYITSDCGAVADIYNGHHYTSNSVEAAAISLKRGVNLSCGTAFGDLVRAVKEGMVSKQQIDSSLATLLKIRFRLGMFDPKEDNPYNKIPTRVINSPQHRALAKKAASESVVMLKNNGVLPLKNDLPQYYMTGPTASSVYALMGNYYGVTDQYVTMLEGVAGHIAPGSQLKYKPGIMLYRPNANPEDWTTGAAKASDVTIVVMGLTGAMEGEEGEAIASSTYGDRMNYNLPQNQIDFLKKLREDNDKPIIAVITGGSPMNLAPVDSLADAVLLAWYPGEEGGNAVADIIFGKTSPSGKLPVTFPQSYDQLPDFEDYSMKGRTYRYMKATPLYTFGFGLSYAQFDFSDMKTSHSVVRKGQTFTVSATLTNKGKYAGDEVVQLYIKDETGALGTPLYALKGFKRVSLQPGTSQKISFRITPEMLAVVNEKGKRVVNPGEHEIYIADAVPTDRSQVLGSPQPVAVSVDVQ